MPEPPTTLKRSLGVVECTLMGIGVMLGAGIYALVGQAALLAGNAVWVSFLVASIVAGFTGLSYAELSSFAPDCRAAPNVSACVSVTSKPAVGSPLRASNLQLG